MNLFGKEAVCLSMKAHTGRFDLLNNSLLPRVGKLAKSIDFYLKDRFAEQGVLLTKEQFLLLKILHDEDGRVQKDLAFITDRNKGSLARLINTMESKGFVERKSEDADKRVNRVYLTDEGRLVFQKTKPVLNACVQQLQKGLSEEEIETTLAILERLHNNINQHS
jgi:DNA-binding MarR family transcriptional regulator